MAKMLRKRASGTFGCCDHCARNKAHDNKPDKKAPDHTGSIGGSGDAEATLAEAAPRDTLTQSDLAAEWRGTSAQ